MKRSELKAIIREVIEESFEKNNLNDVIDLYTGWDGTKGPELRTVYISDKPSERNNYTTTIIYKDELITDDSEEKGHISPVPELQMGWRLRDMQDAIKQSKIYRTTIETYGGSSEVDEKWDSYTYKDNGKHKVMFGNRFDGLGYYHLTSVKISPIHI